ncbi:MAG: hypothetical protein HZB66_02380 [Candidatus Aenigmarchaeota archaeon]|nr:hypothetical protein [Candidatus Aenigmarchaeota archaeon]
MKNESFEKLSARGQLNRYEKKLETFSIHGKGCAFSNVLSERFFSAFPSIFRGEELILIKSFSKSSNIILLSVLLACGVAAAYEMPQYIANPETMECSYYFAGDAQHFNPRPENFTVDIGYVTEFSDVDDACSQWKCSTTKGKWTEGCRCPANSEWVNKTGCMPTGTGLVMTEDELCRKTRGVWAAGVCTCTIGVWKENGCTSNEEPVQEFNSMGAGFSIWALVLIAASGYVMRKRIIEIPGKISSIRKKKASAKLKEAKDDESNNNEN